MKIRNYGALMMALLMTAVLAAVPAVAEEAAEEMPIVVSLTVEELALYNGKDGQPAYVAVKGRVYDVTDVPQWQGGEHQGMIEAGLDQTEAIASAPHGEAVLENLPVVAMLLTGEEMEIPETKIQVKDLAQYTGKDGNKAYVAVDGIVYDVTDSAAWAVGEHAGAYEAGLDYTWVIRETSPHGISVLEGLPVVGRLVFDEVEAES